MAHANYVQALGRWNTTFSRGYISTPVSGYEDAINRSVLMDMGLAGTLASNA
jgi:hypothetical protein